MFSLTNEMHSLVYQILHPWHWLTYGQNAAGLGLIGLFFYTLYTRRMMKLGEATRRANLTPEFSLRVLPEFVPTAYDVQIVTQFGSTEPKVIEYSVVMNIRNIGEGPAIGLQSWHQPVSTKFNIDGSSILLKTSGAFQGLQQGEGAELLKGEITKITFPGFKSGLVPWLFVVEATDLANGKNQLKILMSGPKETTVRMVHALGDSLGERIVGGVNRFVEILAAVKKAFRKLGT
jgi:hypothetical protein